jgi:hypothetical protein
MRKIATVFLASAALWIVGVAITANAQSLTVSVPIILSAPSCTNGVALTGTFPNQTLTCASAGSPTGPSAPAGCQVTSSPPSLSAPGLVQLSVSCGGGVPTSYSWASPGVTFTGGTTTAGNTNGALITQMTAFSVTASNAAGSSTAATVSVQVAGGNTNTGGAAKCTGFANTQFYDWDWAQGGIGFTTGVNGSNVQNPQGPIGPNGIVVIAFTPTATPFGATGNISITAYPGDLNATTRTTAISTSPCDLASQGFPWVRTGNDAGIQFTVGEYVPRLYPPLVAGTRYYINVASRDAAGVSTCANAGRACDMTITVSRP